MAREVVEPLFVGTTEAAQRLGCSSEHVRRLLKRGDLKGRRLGRKIVIHCTEIDRYRAGEPGHEALPVQTNKLQVALAELQKSAAETQRWAAEAQRLLASPER